MTPSARATSHAFARRILAQAEALRSLRISVHAIADAIEAKIDIERALRRLAREIEQGNLRLSAE